MTTIYVPKEEAAAEVIKVNGRCYERVGPVARAPDTLEIEEAYQSCDSCQDSSSSGSEADSISGSGSTCECCVGFIEYFQGVSGEDAGVSGYSYPEPVCADGGVLALTFTLTNNSGATQEGVRITRYGDCGIITSGSPSG